MNAVSKNQGESEYGSRHDDHRNRLIFLTHTFLETPLLLASSLGFEDGVKLLIKSGANVNEICSRIVNETIEVDSPSSDPRSGNFISNIKNVEVRETALHVAAINGHSGVVVVLVAAGADLSILYEYGQEKKSVFEIAQNEDIKKALSLAWSPELHSLYPKAIKEIVKTFLLCKIRNQWNIPKDVLQIILKHTVSVCLMDTGSKTVKKIEKKKGNKENKFLNKISLPSTNTRPRAATESTIKKKKHCIIM